MPQQQITNIGGFERSIAVVIGINVYKNGIPSLTTAANDAQELTRILQEVYHYDVVQILDEQASLENLSQLLSDTLPNKIKPTQSDRLLFYFAGHGTALNSENRDGPAGYILPQDAQPEKRETFLPMQEVHDALTILDCRHALMIFDCCFAGAFRWSTTRDISIAPEVIHKERYDCFIKDPAWQVITSAAYDQKALDILVDNRGASKANLQYSPFAHALFEALQGNSDLVPDGIVTATELYLYLRSLVELHSSEAQTPGLWHLRKHQKGEYIFLLPGYNPDDLPPAPELNKENNPYRGLESFDEAHTKLFFGRKQRTEELVQQVSERSLTIVMGASGTGKSSLVKAGVLPRLRQKTEEQWHILDPVRPGESPLTALARSCLSLIDSSSIGELVMIATIIQRLHQEKQAFAMIVQQWLDTHAGIKLLLLVDQFEELVTLCRNGAERQQFLEVLEASLTINPDRFRIVITLRSDFEPQFLGSVLKSQWMDSRFVIPPMTQDELRQAIEGPASERVLYFEPPTLVDCLINEVVQTPGALPLLSFTLSELYLKYLERRGDNRALTEADYRVLGGVAGSLTQRATQEYEQLTQQEDAYKQTVKRVMLRMVAVEGGEVARRRVPESELQFVDTLENERVDEVIRRLVDARLVVGGQEAGGEAFVEPAHDALVRGWDKIQTWKTQEQENIALQRLLTPAAREWLTHKKAVGFLWDDNPRILLLKKVMRSDQNWLNDLETSFVSQSLQRRQNNRRRLVGSLAIVFLSLSSLTIFAFIQLQLSILREKAALVGNLLPTTRAVDGLVLAIEATGNSQSFLKPLLQPVFNSAVRSRLMSAVAIARERNLLIGHSDYVTAVVFSPDSKYIASSSIDGTIRLWNMQGQLIGKPFSHDGEINSIDFSPDSQFIVSGGNDGTVRLWNLQGQQIGKPFQGHRKGAKVTSVAFTPDGQFVVSGGSDSTVWLWDKRGRQVRRLFQGKKEDRETYVDISQDGRYVAIGITGEGVRIFNFQNRSLSNLIPRHKGLIESVSISSDGQYVVSSNAFKITLTDRQGNEIDVDDIGRDFRPKTFQGDEGGIGSAIISPDGQSIIASSQGIRLYDKQGQQIGQPLEGHSSLVSALAFSPNGQLIVSGGIDGTVRVWDFQSLAVGKPFRGQADPLISFRRDGKYIISRGHDTTLNTSTVQLLDIQGNSVGKPFLGQDMSSDGNFVLSDRDGTVRLWNLQNEAVSSSFPTDLHSLRFSPDGQFVFGVNDNSLQIWNKRGQLVSISKSFGENQYLSILAFSLTNKFIVTSGGDKTLQLWNIDGNPISMPFQGHKGLVTALAFSPDDQLVVSGGVDRNIRLWNKQGHVVGNPFVGHKNDVSALAFSSNSQLIASGSGVTLSRGTWFSADNTVRLWDNQGNPVGEPLIGHEGKVISVAFSPDEQFIASSSNDDTVRIWQVGWQGLLQIACNRLRYHPVLKNPQTEEQRNARNTCQRHVWQNE